MKLFSPQKFKNLNESNSDKVLSKYPNLTWLFQTYVFEGEPEIAEDYIKQYEEIKKNTIKPEVLNAMDEFVKDNNALFDELQGIPFKGDNEKWDSIVAENRPAKNIMLLVSALD